MSDTGFKRHKRLQTAMVWIARIVIGALFIVSGLSKSIDLWGFVYKIEEYLMVWDMMQPRTLVFMAALILSGAEFVLGSLLLLGLYRRSAPVLLTLMMAVMLPLTLYIYIESPVADCGCFGDFIILSNAATFWKNVVITAILIWLIVVNRRVDGLFSIPVQWIVGGVVSLYVLLVGLAGYSVQPMIDFRSFPIGSMLRPADGDDDEYDDTEFEFIYRSADGRVEAFSADSLPDDTWTFVDRRQIAGKDVEGRQATDFVVLDDGDDVTSEVVDNAGEEVMLLIPDLSRADVTYTFALNELNAYLLSRRGHMVALIATDAEGLESWADLSMASYPLYQAEPTLIKELARGNMALVCLRDGVVEWKRTLSSIDPERFMSIDSDDDRFLDSLNPNLYSYFIALTSVTATVLLVLWLLDRSGRFIGVQWRRRHRKSLKVSGAQDANPGNRGACDKSDSAGA